MSDAVAALAGTTTTTAATAADPSATTAATTAAATTTATTPPAWTEGLDADSLKFVETSGYKSPAEALAALRGYQPPETPDGYKLPVPEGADPEFAKTAAGWFHKHKVPAEAAAGFVAEYNAFATAELARMQAEDAQRQSDAEAKNRREDAEIRSEWGAQADAQMELAKRAYTTYVPGATPEEKTKLVSVLQREVGYKATMKMFAAIGAHLAEDTAHGLGGAGSANNPISAATRIYDKSNMNP